MLCENCTATHNSFNGCPWCEQRREELLERLRVDDGVASFATVADWAMTGFEETPKRVWRVG